MTRGGIARFLAALGVCWTFAVPPAAALPRGYSGADILNNCADAALCEAFLLALLDSHDALIAWTRTPSRICPAASATPAALWQPVRARLQLRPELLGASAGSLVLDVLQVDNRCPANAAPARPLFDAAWTGTDLVYLCWNPVLCDAFVFGALDAHQTLVDWQRIPTQYVCLPEDIAVAQMRVGMLTYLGEHTEQLGYTAGSLVLLAMAQRYPC